MIGVRLFLLQRITAIIMVPLVFIHLGLLIYAVRGGLSVDEILSRTRNNLFWSWFYGLFVLAASIHGAIGLRVVIGELFSLKPGVLNAATLLVGLAIMVMGFRAVMAVAG